MTSGISAPARAEGVPEPSPRAMPQPAPPHGRAVCQGDANTPRTHANATSLSVMHFNPGKLSAQEIVRVEQIAADQGIHVACLVGIGWTGHRNHLPKDGEYRRIHIGADKYYLGYAGAVMILLHKSIEGDVVHVNMHSDRLVSVRLRSPTFDITITAFYSYLNHNNKREAEYELNRKNAWLALADHCLSVSRIKRTTHILCMDANAPGHPGLPGFGDRRGPAQPHNRNTGPLGDLCGAHHLDLLNTKMLTGGFDATCYDSGLNHWSRIDYIACSRGTPCRSVEVGTSRIAGLCRTPIDHLPIVVVLDVSLRSRFPPKTQPPPPYSQALLRDPAVQKAFRADLRAVLKDPEARQATWEAICTRAKIHLLPLPPNLDRAVTFLSEHYDRVTTLVADRHFRPQPDEVIIAGHALSIQWKRDFSPSERAQIVEYWDARATTTLACLGFEDAIVGNSSCSCDTGGGCFL